MTADPRRNTLLAQLPDREFAQLEPHLQPMSHGTRVAAYEPDVPIDHVYFPLTSVFSLVAVAEEGAAVEVATTGREGMVGLPVFLGATSSPQTAFCQVPGDSVRLGVADFRRFLTRAGALHAVLSRFTQALMVQISQTVVCNNSHVITVRMARWLLMTQDRVAADEFSLTQEFLAQMLGVHRPTVSETAQRLMAEGMIRYSRGVMRIVDREALERIACECYRIVRAEFDDLGRFGERID